MALSLDDLTVTEVPTTVATATSGVDWAVGSHLTMISVTVEGQPTRGYDVSDYVRVIAIPDIGSPILAGIRADGSVERICPL